MKWYRGYGNRKLFPGPDRLWAKDHIASCQADYTHPSRFNVAVNGRRLGQGIRQGILL